MTRRPHRHKCISSRSLNHCIDRPARCAGAPHSSLERRPGYHRVRVQISAAFTNGLLDMFEMLWRVTGLNVRASGFVRLDFDNVCPECVIAAQSVDYHTVTFGPLRMIRAGVMLFEYGMMNDCGRHGGSDLD